VVGHGTHLNTKAVYLFNPDNCEIVLSVKCISSITARLQPFTDRYGSTDGQFAWAVCMGSSHGQLANRQAVSDT